jgi:ribonuclease E
VYRESDAVTRSLRDYFGDDIGEVLVDDDATFATAQEYMTRFMPPERRRSSSATPTTSRCSRASRSRARSNRRTRRRWNCLGRILVVNYTEALVSIDINSARATRGSDIETTATNTNLEAADEIARQLRIRDIGGLIVIDFIDMESPKNQRDVEDRLRDAVKMDRARIQIGRLSRFGLLEMSRQRLRPSLGESSHLVCPRCTGIGSIRSVESMALAILRLIGEEARKEKTAQIVAQVPVEVATYLINEKREWLRTLEDKSGVELLIVPNRTSRRPSTRSSACVPTKSTCPRTSSSLQDARASRVADPSGTKPEKPQLEPAASYRPRPPPRRRWWCTSLLPRLPAVRCLAAPPPGWASGRVSCTCSRQGARRRVAAPAARDEPRRSHRDGHRPRERDGRPPRHPRRSTRPRPRTRSRTERHGRHRDKDGHRDRDANRPRPHRDGGRDRHRDAARDPNRDANRDTNRDSNRDAQSRCAARTESGIRLANRIANATSSAKPSARRNVSAIANVSANSRLPPVPPLWSAPRTPRPRLKPKRAPSRERQWAAAGWRSAW